MQLEDFFYKKIIFHISKYQTLRMKLLKVYYDDYQKKHLLTKKLYNILYD